MKEEEFVVSAYNFLTWTDKRLSWDPSEYNEVGAIRVQPHHIWTPGVILFNAKDGQFTHKYAVNCIIYSNGLINWLPPALFRTTCSMNVKLFPFDQQKWEFQLKITIMIKNELLE